jgi:DNA polymerase-4
VRIRDYDFKTRQKSRTLPDPVISDGRVAAVAKDLLERLRSARPVPARLLGVSLANLIPEESVDQLSLFQHENSAEGESDRDRALSRALDEVRDKFGRGAVSRGG